MIHLKKKGSYAAVRFNAMKHGILSRYTVLAHEDVDEYQTLHAALVAEHQPTGPTEAHLVEELAGIIWRKRRVLQAEGARINDSLKSTARHADDVIRAAAPFESRLSGRDTNLQELMSMTPEQVTENQDYAQEDLEATRKAAAILESGGANAYEQALRALLPNPVTGGLSLLRKRNTRRLLMG